MKDRIINKGKDRHWKIRTSDFKLVPEEEREKLKDYFDEIRLNYHIVKGDVQIDGSIEWEVIDERMKHFYGGWAEFTPF